VLISRNKLKTAGDVEEVLKNLFKDTIQERIYYIGQD